jgi:hypothetical protein
MFERVIKAPPCDEVEADVLMVARAAAILDAHRSERAATTAVPPLSQEAGQRR